MHDLGRIRSRSSLAINPEHEAFQFPLVLSCPPLPHTPQLALPSSCIPLRTLPRLLTGLSIAVNL